MFNKKNLKFSKVTEIARTIMSQKSKNQFRTILGGFLSALALEKIPGQTHLNAEKDFNQEIVIPSCPLPLAF